MSPPAEPRVLCVAGPSGGGKTTLLRRLLPRLPVPRERIGVVKHTHHAVDWHPAGKDSGALWDAGPAALCVAGPGQTAVFRRAGRADAAGERADGGGSGRPGDPTRALAAACRALPDGLRLVLAEGFRRARVPKIWTAAGPPEPEDRGPDAPGPGVRAVVVPRAAVPAWEEALPGTEVRARERAAGLAERVPGWARPLSELPAG